MPFTVTDTALSEVKLLTPLVHRDARGFFTESWNARDFALALGRDVVFVQDNRSQTRRGGVRGLHWQTSPHPQAKLISCTAGEIFDVVVDIRPESETFARWAAVTLSSQTQQMLWVPEGFAHGFAALTETADVFYKTTDYRYPECEAVVRWNDPDIAARWPESCDARLMSVRDATAPLLREVFAEVFAFRSGA
ncbi:MAG: dTDP-4-dehydrorhamnose 3,5-epimerase [Duodenibacillus sp.]